MFCTETSVVSNAWGRPTAEPFAGWGPITRRSASTVCTNWEYQWTSMSIVNIWTGSIRPFCNVLFVKTNDKYWLRARSRIRDTHRVSTVLVNYIGTTVSPALFIVRHRRKLLNERLVVADAPRFASRCPPPTLGRRFASVRPSLFPESSTRHVAPSLSIYIHIYI